MAPSLSTLTACGGDESLGSVDRSVVPGTEGHVPDGLPKRLTVGVYAVHGDTWMADSGVPWDARFRYLARAMTKSASEPGREDGVFGPVRDQELPRGAECQTRGIGQTTATALRSIIAGMPRAMPGWLGRRNGRWETAASIPKSQRARRRGFPGASEPRRGPRARVRKDLRWRHAGDRTSPR
jgi:hypothetical protein